MFAKCSSLSLFIGLGITLTNLFYSNPALSAIPEGYTPKEWEYHPNPITRYVHNGGHNDWCLTYIGNTSNLDTNHSKNCFSLLTRHLNTKSIVHLLYKMECCLPTLFSKTAILNFLISDLLPSTLKLDTKSCMNVTFITCGSLLR